MNIHPHPPSLDPPFWLQVRHDCGTTAVRLRYDCVTSWRRCAARFVALEAECRRLEAECRRLEAECRRLMASARWSLCRRNVLSPACFGHFRAMRSRLRPLWARCRSGRSGPVWVSQGRSGLLRSALGRLGPPWAALGRSGPLWAALGRLPTLLAGASYLMMFSTFLA